MGELAKKEAATNVAKRKFNAPEAIRAESQESSKLVEPRVQRLRSSPSSLPHQEEKHPEMNANAEEWVPPLFNANAAVFVPQNAGRKTLKKHKKTRRKTSGKIW